MESFLVDHESKLDLPKIEKGSGHTIFEFVPNDSGNCIFPVTLMNLSVVNILFI